MAWTTSTTNDFTEYSESLTIPDSAGANESTVNSSSIDANLVDDAQYLVKLEVTETSGGNGSADIRLQGSPDGTNWTNIDTSAGLSVDTTGTNTGVGILDFAKTKAAEYRLQIFTDGTDILDSADVTVTFYLSNLR